MLPFDQSFRPSAYRNEKSHRASTVAMMFFVRCSARARDDDLASLRLRSVISWKQLTAPTTFPPLSLIASMSTSGCRADRLVAQMWTSCSRTETPVAAHQAMGH